MMALLLKMWAGPVGAFLKAFWPYIVAVVVLLGLLWYSHHKGYVAGEHDGRVSVQRQWDEEKVVQMLALKKAAEKAAKTEAEQARVAKEIENGLQISLERVTDTARSLSERVRDYQSRRCLTAVPQVPPTPSQPAGTARVPEDGGAVGEATDSHYAACARDAKRLEEWQHWYSEVKDK